MNSHIIDHFLRLLRCFRHSLLVRPEPQKVHVFAILLVIVFTGCMVMLKSDHGLAHNIAGVISKPYGTDQLREVLKKVLEG